MIKETAGTSMDLSSLIALLKRERCELKVKIHLARCGIQKEWEKAETKWQCVHEINSATRNTVGQLAEELQNSYTRIYRGLLEKNCKLLDRLNALKLVANPATLESLKLQVASEIAAMLLKLETLGCAGPIQFQPEEEPVCACLKCRQESGMQPFNLDEILAAATTVNPRTK